MLTGLESAVVLANSCVIGHCYKITKSTHILCVYTETVNYKQTIKCGSVLGYYKHDTLHNITHTRTHMIFTWNITISLCAYCYRPLSLLNTNERESMWRLTAVWVMLRFLRNHWNPLYYMHCHLFFANFVTVNSSVQISNCWHMASIIMMYETPPKHC